jgi:hypothetical protein
MSFPRLAVLALAAALAVPVAGQAQDLLPPGPGAPAFPGEGPGHHGKGMRWMQMTPEQRSEALEQLRARHPERADRLEEMMRRWDEMSPEQRAQAEERRRERHERFGAMRHHWQQMSEEDRAAATERYREHRQAMRERWEQMTPEERDAFRREMRERHGKRGERTL